MSRPRYRHRSASAREPVSAEATLTVSELDSLVAICMATHDPPETLFEAQVDSIRRQTHQNFICVVADDASSAAGWERIRRVVGDDPRFAVSRSPVRLGFYANFERALGLVPEEAEYVGFADQDDRWDDDKVETLVQVLRSSGAALAYSDMRIVDEHGTPIRDSYWADRRNAYDSVASLLMMNTVTGAACLFRRELLADALPFPELVGTAYHDHWLASVALATGRISYVDRALYDYVQHGANAAGAFAPSSDFRGGLVHALRRFAADPRGRLRSAWRNAPEYALEAARVERFARTLQQRLGDRVNGDKQKALHRAAHLDRPGAILWLLARAARDIRGRSETLGVEVQLAKGILWRRSAAWRRRVRRI
jgi:O-antigen biosynthesis protein